MTQAPTNERLREQAESYAATDTAHRGPRNAEIGDDDLLKALHHRGNLMETAPTDAYVMLAAERRITELLSLRTRPVEGEGFVLVPRVLTAQQHAVFQRMIADQAITAERIDNYWTQVLELSPPGSKPDDGADRAIADIAAERLRQTSKEGWTPEHDDEHETGQIASAAACYASPDDFKTKEVPREWSDASRYMDAHSEPMGRVTVPAAWPWDGQWWKPTTPRRNLVKAGALIVAEIERIDRTSPGVTNG